MIIANVIAYAENLFYKIIFTKLGNLNGGHEISSLPSALNLNWFILTIWTLENRTLPSENQRGELELFVFQNETNAVHILRLSKLVQRSSWKWPHARFVPRFVPRFVDLGGGGGGGGGSNLQNEDPEYFTAKWFS